MIRVVAWSIVLAFIAGCTGDPGTGSTATPAATPAATRFGDGTFVLFRLNGDRYPGEPVAEGAELLHQWEILETLPIPTPQDRSEIFMAFEDGMEDARRNPGIPVDCFRPRHAIRIDRDGTTTDHLICFECRNFMTWTDGEMTGGGATSKRPQAVFESFLEAGASGR